MKKILSNCIKDGSSMSRVYAGYHEKDYIAIRKPQWFYTHMLFFPLSIFLLRHSAPINYRASERIRIAFFKCIFFHCYFFRFIYFFSFFFCCAPNNGTWLTDTVYCWSLFRWLWHAIPFFALPFERIVLIQLFLYHNWRWKV